MAGLFTSRSCFKWSAEKLDSSNLLLQKKLLTALIILTVLFGALAVFSLVVLTATCYRRRQERSYMEEPLTSNSFEKDRVNGRVNFVKLG